MNLTYSHGTSLVKRAQFHTLSTYFRRRDFVCVCVCVFLASVISVVFNDKVASNSQGGRVEKAFRIIATGRTKAAAAATIDFVRESSKVYREQARELGRRRYTAAILTM